MQVYFASNAVECTTQDITTNRLTRLHYQIEQEHWEEAQSYLQTQDGIEESRIFSNGSLPIHFALGLRETTTTTTSSSTTTTMDKNKNKNNATTTKTNWKNKTQNQSPPPPSQSPPPPSTATPPSTPLSIIKALITAFPQSLRLCGTNGMLPLHVAAYYHAPIETLLHLIRTYPDALDVADDNDHTPNEYDYNDPDKVLERSSVCYQTQDARHGILHRREQKFCQMLPKYQLVLDRQKKVNRQLGVFEEAHEKTMQLVQKKLKTTEERITTFMDALEGIQDEVDGFLTKTNGRLVELQADVKRRDGNVASFDTEHGRRSIGWYMQLKEIDGDMEKIRMDTEECGRLVVLKLEERRMLSSTVEEEKE